MGMYFYPRLTAVAANNKEVNRLVNEQTEIGILLALPGLLGTMIFSPWVIKLLYSTQFIEAANLLPWFILGIFGRVVSWPLGFVQLAKGAARWFAATEFVINGLHLFLIWLGLRWFGLKGVAVAFAILYGFYTLLMLLVAGRLSHFCWSGTTLRLLMEACALLAGVFLLARFASSSIALVLGGIIVSACGLVCLRRICLRLGKNHRVTVWLGRIPSLGPAADLNNCRHEAKADETPLVSFILLAYNQERFVREAVAGALAQTYSPLEIILSDDCSTDETFRLMCQAAEEYDGPHRLILNRNKVNIGIAEHLNLLTKTASGSIFVVAAADDVSLPHRTEALIGQFKNNPSVTAAYSGAIDEDEKGREIAKSAVNEPSTERFRPHSIINSLFGGFGATYAWRREVFERFGPISARLRSEDVVIPFRCALLGEINYTDIPLVHYRRHQTNTWKHTHEFASWRDYYGWHKARAQDVIEVLSQMSADLVRLCT